MKRRIEIMKNYTTPDVTFVKIKEDVITTSNNYLVDTFDDLHTWEGEQIG